MSKKIDQSVAEKLLSELPDVLPEISHENIEHVFTPISPEQRAQLKKN